MHRRLLQQAARAAMDGRGPDLLTPVAAERGQRVASGQGLHVARIQRGAQGQVFGALKQGLRSGVQETLGARGAQAPHQAQPQTHAAIGQELFVSAKPKLYNPRHPERTLVYQTDCRALRDLA